MKQPKINSLSIDRKGTARIKALAKNKRKIKAVRIDSAVIASLTDPEVAAAYIQDCLAEKGPNRSRILFRALMNIAQARGISKQPKNPFHPGEILLEEFLIPAGISQAKFAQKIGWSVAKLNEIIKGKRGITAETALDLSVALKTSPKIWMNLQATYDLDQALKK